MLRYDPGPVHIGSVVHKVALGQVCVLALRFCAVSVIPPRHNTQQFMLLALNMLASDRIIKQTHLIFFPLYHHICPGLPWQGTKLTSEYLLLNTCSAVLND
jgi:hypothetical protein